MSNAKKSISRRFMAALLSFVLVLGLIPTSALTAYAATPEHPNGVTVSVTDQDGKGIAGATVEYHINSTVNGADYASGTATTDENGCAEVLAADKFIADDLTLLNCTPPVRQYDILSNKWGVLLCQKEYQTNDIRQNSKNW